MDGVRNPSPHFIQLVTAVVALAFFVSSFLVDLAYLASNVPELLDVGYWITTVGIVVGLLALPWSWFAAAKEGSNKTDQVTSSIIFTTVVLLFIGNWYFRQITPGTIGPRAALFSFFGFGVAILSALSLHEIYGRQVRFQRSRVE